MRKIILVAESGADIPKEALHDDSIFIVPMHISMGDRNLDDGTFPQSEIFTYYAETGKIPKTSAPAPAEYRKVFEEIHQTYPASRILHLCYSAATTSSMQNAVIGSEGMDFVTHMDSRCATAGQALLVLRTAEYIRKNTKASLEDVTTLAEEWIGRSRMALLPENIEFLRAGGRVSNAAYLGASLLNIKPLIELIDGRLVCGKKYHGTMARVIKKFLQDKLKEYDWEEGQFAFVYTEGLDQERMWEAEQIAKDFGINNPMWIKAVFFC